MQLYFLMQFRLPSPVLAPPLGGSLTGLLLPYFLLSQGKAGVLGSVWLGWGGRASS